MSKLCGQLHMAGWLRGCCPRSYAFCMALALFGFCSLDMGHPLICTRAHDFVSTTTHQGHTLHINMIALRMPSTQRVTGIYQQLWGSGHLRAANKIMDRGQGTQLGQCSRKVSRAAQLCSLPKQRAPRAPSGWRIY